LVHATNAANHYATLVALVACRSAQIGLIVGTVVGGLIVISIVISIIVISCRQKALADKKTVERAAQIIGATEVEWLTQLSFYNIFT